MIAFSKSDLISGACEEEKEMYSHDCESVWSERSCGKRCMCLWVWKCVRECVGCGALPERRKSEQREGGECRVT